MTVYIKIIGKGKPLVFFHGWGFNHEIWQPLLPYLTKYQLFLVDLPGFGLSPWTHWFAFIPKLLSQLPDFFNLLGWSMGGLYASRLAIENPWRVNALINVASSPCFVSKPSWPGIKPQTLKDFMQQIKNDPKQTLNQFLQTQLTDYYKLNYDWPSEIFALEQGLDALLTWDLRSKLANLSNNHYILGRRDTIVPSKLITVMKRQYPMHHCYQFPSAHVPFLSHTELFLNLLDSILW